MKTWLTAFLLLTLLIASPACLAAEPATGFEQAPAGVFKTLDTPVGQWSTEPGHAVVHDRHARSGKQSLRLLGGDDRVVEFVPVVVEEASVLTFWAERWTGNEPFVFRIERFEDGEWNEVYNGDKKIAVGGFDTQVILPLEAGPAARYRFRTTTPADKGLMIDDVTIDRVGPRHVARATTAQPDYPALVRAPASAIARVRIDVAGTEGEAPVVSSLRINTRGTTDLADVAEVALYYTGAQDAVNGWDGPNIFGDAKPFDVQPPAESIIFRGTQPLSAGANYFWVSFRLKDEANIDHRLDAGCEQITLADGSAIEPHVKNPEGSQRMGVAVRMAREDDVHTYRIPGLATTNNGTLIGVYDIRRRASSGDLPGDVDVGMSRSTDGGRTWEPMRVIMDQGEDPKWHFDGVGDPAVLVDRKTGTIWVAALWSHGNRAWSGSGPGLEPGETGQLLLVRSDDDGKTWSEPINITEQIKRPEWNLVFNGPGMGITMRDGTLVFAAQYQDTKEAERLPRSTIIYSRDRGKTWQIGTGAFDDTTEAQVAEIAPGVLMLNCRYNRQNRRVVMITRDMGRTWTEHPTSRKALIEPHACMASLIALEGVGEAEARWLAFSNPHVPDRPRRRMTIQLSSDAGESWPERYHLLLDEGSSAGYSCLTQIDDKTLGILYEGSQAHMTFQRIPIAEIKSAAGR